MHWPKAIYLLRHGEKPDGDPDDHGLTAEGRVRARMLADFLAGDRFGPPTALFATKTSHHGGGVRTQETLAPLAIRLGLDVEAPFSKTQYPKLAELLTQGSYRGQHVVVCWDHENLPALATELGAADVPAVWPKDAYDVLWVLTHVNGQVSREVVHEPNP